MIKTINTGHGKTVTIWYGIQWKAKSIDEETKAFLLEYKKIYPDKPQPNYTDVYGELFGIRYVSQLTKTASRIDIFKVIDPIEGKDFVCFDILGRNGNAEIKTIRPFLTQNNNPRSAPDDGGSIPFEIFHRWIPDEYEEMYAGWLLSAYSSKTYNKIKAEHGREERAETPGLYIYVLMGSNGTPYACIVFENIAVLLNRLLKICPDAKGWGIPNPRTLTPASNRAYWNKFDAKQWYDSIKGAMIQNCWNVPFKSICDLATVTLINSVDIETELQKAQYKCSTDVARARYKLLHQVAERDGRKDHFDPEKHTKDENEKVKKHEKAGTNISKRNFVNIQGQELENLKKGITVYYNGEIRVNDGTETVIDDMIIGAFDEQKE